MLTTAFTQQIRQRRYNLATLKSDGVLSPAMIEPDYCKQGYSDPSPGGKPASNHVIYQHHQNEPVARHNQLSRIAMPNLDLPCRLRSCSPNRVVACGCITQLLPQDILRNYEQPRLILTFQRSRGPSAYFLRSSTPPSMKDPGSRQSCEPCSQQAISSAIASGSAPEDNAAKLHRIADSTASVGTTWT